MAVQGVDVSSSDGTIDWARAKQAGITFAYVKATEGVQRDTNSSKRAAYFQANWIATNASGLLRGAYHFFRDNLDAQSQADAFVQAIHSAGGLNDNDLPPMLDVESNDGAEKPTRILRVHRCLARIQEELGVRPLLYTYRSFWDEFLDDSFGAYSLWIAAYGTDKPIAPTVPTRPAPSLPAGFADFVFWQYAEFGSVDGMNGGVDLNLA